MKIIIVSGSNDSPTINILADSALQKTGKPFFVPDFADRLVGSTHVCAHISRLGKNIAKRFSERYYEQIGLCFAIQAEADNLPVAVRTGFDGALVVGTTVDKSTFAGAVRLEQRSLTTAAEVTVDDVCTRLDSAIELVSKYFTIKIGDLIVVDCGFDNVALNIDDKIECNIADSCSISFRIK